jgi:putative transposase
MYRDAVQLVVNEVWKLDKVHSTKKLHTMFYEKLRVLGFRAHHVLEVCKCAREIVKPTKNKGSKPVLRRLTARISTYDYKIAFSRKILRPAVLNGQWVELKLKWYSHLDKYLDSSWRLGEIQLSYRDGEILVYLTFSKEVKLKELETVMGMDMNFNNITYTVVDLNGNLVSMGATLFRGLRQSSSP